MPAEAPCEDEVATSIFLYVRNLAGDVEIAELPAGATVADFFDNYGKYLCYEDITLPLTVRLETFLSLPYVENSCDNTGLEGYTADEYPPVDAWVKGGRLMVYRYKNGATGVFLDAYSIRALPSVYLSVHNIQNQTSLIVSGVPNDEVARHVLVEYVERVMRGEQVDFNILCESTQISLLLDRLCHLFRTFRTSKSRIIIKPTIRSVKDAESGLISVFSSLHTLLQSSDAISVSGVVLHPENVSDQVRMANALSGVMSFLAENRLAIGRLHLGGILPSVASIAAAAVTCEEVSLREKYDDNADFPGFLDALGRQEGPQPLVTLSASVRTEAEVCTLEDKAFTLGLNVTCPRSGGDYFDVPAPRETLVRYRELL